MNVHLKQETNKHQIVEPFNEGPLLYFLLSLSDFMNLGTRVVCLNNNLDYYVETLVTLTTRKTTSGWTNRNKYLSPDTPAELSIAKTKVKREKVVKRNSLQ